jgi:hypothetical protein
MFGLWRSVGRVGTVREVSKAPSERSFMIILLPLLAKLNVTQRIILGRTLVILGAIFLVVGFTGHPWLVGVSGFALLVGLVSLGSGWRGRRKARANAAAVVSSRG